MPEIPWIIITLVILFILVVLLIIRRKELAKRPTDYRAFFILGVAFLPIGIATKNYAFLGLGIIYIILGLKNKDKWNKKIKLSKKEIKNKIILMWVLLGLLILGVLVFFLFERLKILF